MSLSTGTRIGPYEILGTLGAGGMGEVFRARDTRLGRDVAIKVLPSGFALDAERLTRFEGEARVLASLNHPHIAQIYGLEGHDGRDGPPFIVMEFVDGQTLADRLRRRPSGLVIQDALAIARQIADALDAAHERGIVHRDLKPANIVITADESVKVLDFGLAKAGGAGGQELTDSPTVMGPTLDGVVLGTAPYMSPEQARGKPVDKRTDIWAFGCVLYEMLTGRRAFAGETTSDTIAAILEREPRWTQLPASTPPHIQHLLRRCLAKDPRRRLRDIGDVVADLDPIASNRIATAHSEPRWRRAAILLAAVLVVTAAAGVIMRPRTAPPDESTAQAVAVQLTDYGGHETSPAISPDGRSVVFVSDHAGTPDLWLRQVAGGEPLRLTNDAASESDVAFAPDGEQVYFTRVDGRDESIWRIPVLGGQPTKVIAGAHVPSISHDGRRMAFFVRQPENAATLVVSALDGSARRTMAEHVPPFPPLRASWSPDDRQLSYARAGLFAPSNLYVIDTETGAEGQVTHFARAGTGIGKHEWLRDGRHLAVSYSNSTATQALFAIGVLDIHDGSIVRVAGSIRESLAAPSISRDSSRLVAINMRNVRDVWRVSAAAADPDVNGKNASRLIDTAKDPLWTFVTRNGLQLLYNSPATGSRNLWMMPIDGSTPPRQLTSMADDAVGHSSLSPDGNRLAFVSFAHGTSDIWMQNVDGSDLRQLTDDPAADSWPVWSPDGQQIVFTSGIGGAQETRVLRVADRAVSKLVDGFFRGDWVRKPSGDGSYIITSTGNSRIRLLDVDRKAVVWDHAVPGSGNAMPMFSGDGRSFVIATQADLDHDVIQVGETATGNLRVVVRLPFHTTFRVNWIDNGRAFVVNHSDQESHIVLIDRFWTRDGR